ncbi:hypothetical protein Scep_019553 [Stephania cephalantha]|uniref:Uncharacterized protein n=1 Tax=Stephania cephalantha TaxID=152367 RepID=A0AAP0IAZ7_9MAGN
MEEPTTAARQRGMTVNSGDTTLTFLIMKKKGKKEIEEGGIVLVDDKSHLKKCGYWLNLWIEKDLKLRTPSMTRYFIHSHVECFTGINFHGMLLHGVHFIHQVVNCVKVNDIHIL